MKENLKKPFIIGGISVFLLVLIIIIAFSFSGSKKVENSIFEVKRGKITNNFNVVGQVKPKDGVDLAFERSGKVSGKYYSVGDKVSVGKTLASLENYDLVANLHQAEANLKIQQAKFDELKRGARPQDLDIQESKLSGAGSSLIESKRNLIDKIQDAYTKSDDAIRGKVDQLFSNPKSTTPKLTFTISDSQLEYDIEFNRTILESTLNKWYSLLNTLNISEDLSVYSDTTIANLNSIKSFLDKVAFVVNGLTPNSQLSLATISGWRFDISTVRSNINTSIAGITSAKDKLEASVANYETTSSQYNLIIAGATEEQIRAQEGQVDAARAAVESAQAQISKTIIRAPFSGEVAKDDVVVGQIVSPNIPMISLVSNKSFDIQVNIPETNVSMLKVGDTAKVTLDAYGNKQIFDAKIISLDTAQTIVDGIAVYRAKLQFTTEDQRIKTGMTANVTISSASGVDKIFVPDRAIFKKKDKNIVFVVGADGLQKEREVVVGIRGVGENTEIVSGLKEGEKVFVY
ncbi:MAG: efflux RND transporter periplasmic adaptor subunit [bacterium]